VSRIRFIVPICEDVITRDAIFFWYLGPSLVFLFYACFRSYFSVGILTLGL
jgi:hypothetical protein